MKGVRKRPLLLQVEELESRQLLSGTGLVQEFSALSLLQDTPSTRIATVPAVTAMSDGTTKGDPGIVGENLDGGVSPHSTENKVPQSGAALQNGVTPILLDRDGNRGAMSPSGSGPTANGAALVGGGIGLPGVTPTPSVSASLDGGRGEDADPHALLHALEDDPGPSVGVPQVASLNSGGPQSLPTGGTGAVLPPKLGGDAAGASLSVNGPARDTAPRVTSVADPSLQAGSEATSHPPVELRGAGPALALSAMDDLLPNIRPVQEAEQWAASLVPLLARADAPLRFPQESGPLSDVLPFDSAALQAGVERFLERLDRLGQVLMDRPADGLGTTPWLLATAAAFSACEITRRHLMRQPRGAAEGGDDVSSFAILRESASGSFPKHT